MSAPGTVAELFDAAADIVAKRGLNKGGFLANPMDPDSPCCADAAIRIAAGGTPHNPLDVPDEAASLVGEAEWLLADYAIRDGGRECVDANEDFDPIETIAGWNDQPTNDAVNVIEALRDVAELAR